MKTYKNNTSEPIFASGQSIAPGETAEFIHYIHVVGLDLIEDSDPKNLVVTTGSIQKNTDETHEIPLNLAGIGMVEIQVAATSGKWELYFNSMDTKPVEIPTSGAFNKVVKSKFLNKLILKAKDDTATCTFNVVVER